MMPRPTTSFLSVQVLVVGQKMKKLFWIWNTFVLSQVQKRIEGKKNYVCANPSPPKKLTQTLPSECQAGLCSSVTTLLTHGLCVTFFSLFHFISFLAERPQL